MRTRPAASAGPRAEGVAVAWLEQLGSADRTLQRSACERAIEALRADPELRPALLDRLHGEDFRERFAAAFVLFRYEGPSMRLLAALVESLGLSDGDARWQAASMLVTLGQREPEVLPVLLHEARHAADAVRRRMSLYALRELGPEREETEHAFIEALGDGVAEVRRAALSCFAKLTQPSPRALELSVRIARGDGDPRMRRIAVAVLPALSQAHPRSTPEIMAVLEELGGADDPSLVRAARSARQQLAARVPSE